MRVNRILLSMFLAVLATAIAFAQVDHSINIAAVEKNLAARMEHYKVPGASIAVIADYRIAWARAYGTACDGSDRALETNTLFQSGSLAKPVAAIAVLALIQQGTFELDRDINDYLRSWKLSGPSNEEYDPATLRMLLSHTAGIGYERIIGYRRGTALPTLLQILDGAPPAHNRRVFIERTPGTSFTYANSAFLVVQLAIEETLERLYPDVVHEIIFDPLVMNDSHYSHPLSDTLEPRVACGHTADGTMVEGGWRDVPELAATGLWTTSSDIARYVIEIMNASAERKSAVLSAESARAMLTPNSDNVGLSVFIYGSGESRHIQHGGAAVGYRNMFIAYPAKGFGAVVMTNGDQGYDLINEIMSALAREYEWPE